MTTTRRTRDYYVDRVEAHLLKKYPGMKFEVDHVNDRETFIYCYPSESVADEYDITERAGNIVTDALVDSGYRFYVMSAVR